MAAVDIVIVILAGLIPITAASLYSLIDRTTSAVDTSQPVGEPPEAEDGAIPEQGAAAAEDSPWDAEGGAPEDEHPAEQEQSSDECDSGRDALTAVTVHHSPAPAAAGEPEAAR
ncbi:hypothetical protein GCM10027174_23650 [Salinifilum aidingensis]